jgi:uncharacterized protein affecting Mg2+/Co2+ transport
MITSKRLLEQLHKERLECATVMATARWVYAMQVQLDNIAKEASKAETRYWKKRALAAEEKIQQRIINR